MQDFLKFSILLHPRALSFNPAERVFHNCRFSDSFFGEYSERWECTLCQNLRSGIGRKLKCSFAVILKVPGVSLNFELGNICGKSELFHFLMVNVGGTPQYWKFTFKGEQVPVNDSNLKVGGLAAVTAAVRAWSLVQGCWKEEST